MLTIDEVRSDIERFEKRLKRQKNEIKNTELAIAGSKEALRILSESEIAPCA